MARPRDVPGFDCEERFGPAAARVVAVRAAEVFEHSRGVLDTEDVERVHDMRVATRRLRAAMEVFEPCFPRKRFRSALKEVKALADALGERRDRDVEIEFLEGFADEVDPADREPSMPDRPVARGAAAGERGSGAVRRRGAAGEAAPPAGQARRGGAA